MDGITNQAVKFASSGRFKMFSNLNLGEVSVLNVEGI